MSDTTARWYSDEQAQEAAEALLPILEAIHRGDSPEALQFHAARAVLDSVSREGVPGARRWTLVGGENHRADPWTEIHGPSLEFGERVEVVEACSVPSGPYVTGTDEITRLRFLADWIERDRREPDKVGTYAHQVRTVADRLERDSVLSGDEGGPDALLVDRTMKHLRATADALELGADPVTPGELRAYAEALARAGAGTESERKPTVSPTTCPYDHRGDPVRLVPLKALVVCGDCDVPILRDDCRTPDGRLVCGDCAMRSVRGEPMCPVCGRGYSVGEIGKPCPETAGCPGIVARYPSEPERKCETCRGRGMVDEDTRK